MRTLLALLIAVRFVVALPGVARADHVVINDGLTPPDPEHVIDDATHLSDDVYVRNVGCPSGWPAGNAYAPCPSPNDPTEVALTDGGIVAYLHAYDSSTITISGGTGLFLAAYGSSTATMSEGTMEYGLYAYDSSTITISGGTTAWDLSALDSSTITMSGGEVWGYLYALNSSSVTMSGGTVGRSLDCYDSSSVTMSGGTLSYGLSGYGYSTVTMSGGIVWEDLAAYDFSTITIVGRNFEVDGVPTPYGDLVAQTGTLAGTLASGDPINNTFYQGGHDAEFPCTSFACTGTIALASPSEICGDGFIDGAEACDDGGTTPGDGCNASCEIETGWICTGEPSACSEHVLPTLSPWSQLALMACLLGAGLGMWRRQAA